MADKNILVDGMDVYMEEEQKSKRLRLNSPGSESSVNEGRSLFGGIKELKDMILSMQNDITDLKSKQVDILKVVQDVEVVKEGLQEVKRRTTDLEKKVDRLFQRIEGQGKELHSVQENIVKTKDRVVDTEDRVRQLDMKEEGREKRMFAVEGRTIDQEARGRRANLIFHGIPDKEERHEGKKVASEFIKKELKIDHPIAIDKAHRIGQKIDGKDRPLIVKFIEHEQLLEVSKARTKLPSGMGISQDMPFEVRAGRRRLIPKLIEARDAGKSAVIAYPCRLIIDNKEVEVINPADMKRSSRR